MVLGLVPSILGSKPSSHTLPVKGFKQVQVFAAKPDDSKSILRTNTARELTPTVVLLFSYVCHGVYAHVHTQVHTYRKILIKQFTTYYIFLTSQE